MNFAYFLRLLPLFEVVAFFAYWRFLITHCNINAKSSLRGECYEKRKISSLTTEKRCFTQGNDTDFSIDVCIVCEDVDGNYHRLIHEKTDRVIQKCRAASTKVGGTGIRYTVQICGKPTFLFDEENGKWFVEAKS